MPVGRSVVGMVLGLGLSRAGRGPGAVAVRRAEDEGRVGRAEAGTRRSLEPISATRPSAAGRQSDGDGSDPERSIFLQSSRARRPGHF